MLTKNELSSLDHAGLKSELVKARAELFRLRMEHGMRQLKKTHEIGENRKYVARILTFMRAIELERPLSVSSKPEKVKKAKPAKKAEATETSDDAGEKPAKKKVAKKAAPAS